MSRQLLEMAWHEMQSKKEEPYATSTPESSATAGYPTNKARNCAPHTRVNWSYYYSPDLHRQHHHILTQFTQDLVDDT